MEVLWGRAGRGFGETQPVLSRSYLGSERPCLFLPFLACAWGHPKSLNQREDVRNCSTSPPVRPCLRPRPCPQLPPSRPSPKGPATSLTLSTSFSPGFRTLGPLLLINLPPGAVSSSQVSDLRPHHSLPGIPTAGDLLRPAWAWAAPAGGRWGGPEAPSQP